jgi:hypothetical protein
MSAYLILYKPYYERRDNLLELMNEQTLYLLLVVSGGCLIVDEQMIDADTKHIFGYVLLAILSLNLFVNYIVFMVGIVGDIFKKIRKTLAKCNKKKEIEKKINKQKRQKTRKGIAKTS